MKILIVEDEEKLARFIKRGLEAENYTVDVVYDGEKAESQIQFGNYDCVILDIMLPKKDGITVCKNIRDKGILSYIIILTAKNSLDDKIAGLTAGADDYLTKPFEFEELKARIYALIRRSGKPIIEKLSFKNLIMETLSHKVYISDKELFLTPKEYLLLELLLRNKGQVLTRDQILEHCWGYDFDSFSNIVDVYIKRVRKKLKNISNEEFIKTVRGVGYTLEK